MKRMFWRVLCCVLILSLLLTACGTAAGSVSGEAASSEEASSVAPASSSGRTSSAAPVSSAAATSSAGTSSAGASSKAPPVRMTTIESTLPFSKGLNVNGLETDAYTATDAESITYYLSQASTFSDIKAKGFDFVRLPVDLRKYYDAASKKLLTSGDYNVANIDGVIKRATDAGLYVILVLYGWSDINPADSTQAATFKGLWKALAERYKNGSDKLGFELLNKPAFKEEELIKSLNALQNAVIAEIRKASPDRWIFYAVGDSSQAWFLTEMDGVTRPDPPKGDKHVSVSVQLFKPEKFVRQTEPEEGKQPVRIYDTSLSGFNWDVRKIGDYDLNYGFPGFLSECAVSRYAVSADVRDYMGLLLEQCVQYGVPMCYWSYCDTTTDFLPARNGWNGEWNASLLTGLAL